MRWSIIIMCLIFMGCVSKGIIVSADEGLKLFGIYPEPAVTLNNEQGNILDVICDKCESENVTVSVEWGECYWDKRKQKMSEYSPIRVSCSVYHGAVYFFRCNDCGFEATLFR